MKIVFMGTPAFAAPTLQSLYESEHEVVGVVTVPDRPKGRGLKMQSSPVKIMAEDFQIPILQPENLRDSVFITNLENFQADLFVVVGFRILPEEVFSMPPKGTINIHASLLPHYRGAAPINWAIINGETETGITIFYIQKRVDTGNIILQEKVTIEPHDTAGSLHDKLMNLAAEAILDAVDMIEDDEVEVKSQIGEVTQAPKITKEMCRIIWEQNAQVVHNFIRGMAPYPCAHTYFNNKLIKIYSSRMIDREDDAGSVSPGTIVELNAKSGLIAVAVKDGFLAIEELQQQGKKSMNALEFVKGAHLNVGDKFE